MSWPLKLLAYCVDFAFRWAVLAYAWPLIGPYILTPCPVFTRVGAIVWAVLGGLLHLGDRLANDERYVLRVGFK